MKRLRKTFYFRVLGAATGAFFLVSLLVACGDNSATPPPTNSATNQSVIKHELVVTDPTAKMARAVVVGKSSAPVDLKYDLLNLPITNQPIEIELALVPTSPIDSMTVSFVGSEGLTLSTGNAPATEKMKTGEVSSVKFTAKADKEDVFYVTVTATTYLAGISSIRNFAFPVIVSAPSAPAETATPTPVAAPAAAKKKK